MQYRATYINSQEKWRDSDTIEMKFIIVDEDNNIVTSLDGFLIKCEIYTSTKEIRLDNDARGGITVSDEVITVSVSTAQTKNISEDWYRTELQISKDGKVFTVFNKEIPRIISDEVDW